MNSRPLPTKIVNPFAALFGVLILALTATPSEALKPRPTVDSVDACISGKGDKSCDGIICSCCYNEGCWICGDAYYDCVWDPAYRKGGAGKGLSTVKPPLSPGVLEPSKPAPKIFSKPDLNNTLIAP
jgi:hypothetical protein